MVDLVKKDLEFLVNLDKKLHFMGKSEFTPNIWGKPFSIYYDDYTKKVMNPREIQRIFRILESNANLIIYPINTCSGFAVGFRVSEINEAPYPGVPNEKKSILTFKEEQLPVGYNFKTLSDYFMNLENIERAKSVGINISNNHTKYEY